MNASSELKTIIQSSFKFQRTVFYGIGVFTGISGLILLVLTFVMPVKPGEESIVLALQITSLIFILFAFGFPYYINARLLKIHKLLFETPQDISEVEPFTARKNGIHAYAVRIHTKYGKMLGFNVIGPKTQEKAVSLIKQLL